MLNQINAQLFTQGCRDVPETSRGLTGWLAQPREIGPQLRARLERDTERLPSLETQLRVIEKHLAEQVQQKQTSRIAGGTRPVEIEGKKKTCNSRAFGT